MLKIICMYVTITKKTCPKSISLVISKEQNNTIYNLYFIVI